MSTATFCQADFEETLWCVGGVPMVRRTETGADGSQTIKWFGPAGAELTPALADVQAATPGACAAAAVPPTKANAALKRTVENAAGVVATDAQSVSIQNVGSKPGVVMGTPLLPGQTSNWQAWLDPVTNEWKLLPAIDFDGSGTTLHVQVQR